MTLAGPSLNMTQKRILLSRLLQEARQKAVGLTGAQKEFLFMERLRPDGHYNTFSAAFELRGPLRVSHFRRALE